MSCLRFSRPLLSYTLAGERRIIVPTLEYKEGAAASVRYSTHYSSMSISSHLCVEESGQTEELLIIAERPLREVGILQAGVSQIMCLIVS